MSFKKSTVLVNLIGEDIPSSQPSPVPVSPSPRTHLVVNNSAPTLTRYNTFGRVDVDPSQQHYHSKCLVEPVFADEDVMLSSSVDSGSSVSMRKKEAAKQWSGSSVNDAKKSTDSQGDWVHLADTNKRSDHLTS